MTTTTKELAQIRVDLGRAMRTSKDLHDAYEELDYIMKPPAFGTEGPDDTPVARANAAAQRARAAMATLNNEFGDLVERIAHRAREAVWKRVQATSLAGVDHVTALVAAFDGGPVARAPREDLKKRLWALSDHGLRGEGLLDLLSEIERVLDAVREEA